MKKINLFPEKNNRYLKSVCYSLCCKAFKGFVLLFLFCVHAAGQPVFYNFTITSSPAEGGTTSPNGTLSIPSGVTFNNVTATPNSGYKFVNWTWLGQSSSSNPLPSITTLSQDFTLTANFAPINNNCTLTLIAEPAGAGIVTGAGVYTSGTNVTISAIPAPGYSFKEWTGDGVMTTSTNPRTVLLSNNITRTAHFIPTPLLWQASGTKVFYNADNVGIGTMDPTTKLEVAGTMKATSYYGNGSTLSGIAKWVINGTKIYFQGNVGIGCTNPNVSLAVNGKIQATEIEIKEAPCSDYVFEKNYKLMKLHELEAFVTNHKHLPEVPSAAEFKKNGYSIGKMDDVLLRKIEELTLYMIELKKENQILKEKIELIEKTSK